MQIRISQTEGTPVYLQIVNQIKYLVAAGHFLPGDELPTIRALAEELLINPNTVARAYRELQQQGVLDKRGTAGSFISNSGSPLAKKEQLKILQDRIDGLLSDARNMGIGLSEIKHLLEQRDRLLK